MRVHTTLPGSTSFLILLALADGPASGSDIQKQIIADTVGVYIGTSSLYRALRRLIALGHIEPITDHGRETILDLTSKGRKCLARETKLLQIMAVTARERVAQL